MQESRKDDTDEAPDLTPGYQITNNEAEAGFADRYAEVAGGDRSTPDQRRHHSGSPIDSGGDVDAAWDRPDVGEEQVGGSVATPDQDVVEEIGEALGITYEDNEPLHTEEKLIERDEKRWELNPASSEDFEERIRDEPA